MARFAALFLLVFLACASSPSQREAAVLTDEPDRDNCSTDGDCLLTTRAALGCCQDCPALEAMSRTRVEEVAKLCNLHQGGETCHRQVEHDDCAAEDPSAWIVRCAAGSCQKEAR